MKRSATRRVSGAFHGGFRFTAPALQLQWLACLITDATASRARHIFFTVNLRDRRSDLLAKHIALLREAVRGVRHELAFHIDAWVVLPDHMRCLWTLPESDSDFPERWRRIKARFTRTLPDAERSPTKFRKGERGIWQRGYWEHTIRNERDYTAHMDYIHFNPVRHGLVTNVGDWPYSSFRRCVAAGLYPPQWLGGGNEPLETGERTDW